MRRRPQRADFIADRLEVERRLFLQPEAGSRLLDFQSSETGDEIDGSAGFAAGEIGPGLPPFVRSFDAQCLRIPVRLTTDNARAEQLVQGISVPLNARHKFGQRGVEGIVAKEFQELVKTP